MIRHTILTSEQRAKIAALIGDAQPATSELLVSFGESVRDRRDHEHPQWEDFYCLNLSSYMGERMAPVLRRLIDAEAQAERYRTAWGLARTRAISTGGAADRYAARAREGQEALQHMLFAIIAAQLARKAATAEAAQLRAQVNELEAVERQRVRREQWAALIVGSEQAELEAEVGDVFVPRTERSYWEAIANALNAAVTVGMPICIDLDGTLTDHNAWSVVWDGSGERWTVAGYEDQTDTALTCEEKDIPAGAQPTGTASTARAQILAALQAAGHTAASAADVLAQADREPRDPEPDPDFRECLGGGHALVVEYGDCELLGSCQCGKPLGQTTPDASLDTFAGPWERHTNTEVA
ncbi:hypothetical protein ACIQVC_37185 [Streptomyces sp. NPDC101112]|uniref:hypothetical protein n=1 Tax=Streptomyces sp. NPDC101112 TaxID=3366105 RepID=UPI0038107AD4